MAVSVKIYNSFLTKQDDGNAIDLDAASTLKCALFSADASAVVLDLTQTHYTAANELATTGGYTKGGATLTGTAISGGSQVKFTCSALSWNNSTFNAAYAQVYQVATSMLILYIDFGGVQSPSAQNFILTPASSGLIIKTSA